MYILIKKYPSPYVGNHCSKCINCSRPITAVEERSPKNVSQASVRILMLLTLRTGCGYVYMHVCIFVLLLVQIGSPRTRTEFLIVLQSGNRCWAALNNVDPNNVDLKLIYKTGLVSPRFYPLRHADVNKLYIINKLL